MQTLKIDNQDGIAIIAFDVPDKSMNVLSKLTIEEFVTTIDKITKDDAVKGIVIASNKKDFLGGVDLEMLKDITDEAKRKGGAVGAKYVYDIVMQFNHTLRQLETCGKPVACAISGTCLGGGFEIALACHYRVAADKDKAQLGLPESKVGLMPGFGGTQRLPRLVGVKACSEALLEGKFYSPKQAKELGFIHTIVPQGEELQNAIDWVKNASNDDAIQAWDKKGYKIPDGNAYTPTGYPLFAAGNAMMQSKTYGCYDAQKHIMQAVYEGLLVSLDEALKIEATHFSALALGSQSGNMIRTLFLSKQALEKGARRPKDIDQMPVKKLAVVGSGMMGASIAFVAAKAGIDVLLLDKDLETVKKSIEKLQKNCEALTKKGKMTQEIAQSIISKITPIGNYETLKGCDLVIEAVFEDIKIKKTVLENIEKAVSQYCIIATNTSTLPINELSNFIVRKKNFVGLHFFSPVELMPLVEIIKGKKTSDKSVAKGLDFVKQLKKTPIVVEDALFFYANRCIIPYIEEAHYMVMEGINPALIENAAKMLGFPVGVLQLNDEVALDLSLKIHKMLKFLLKDKYEENPSSILISKMVALGRLGKKSNKGFYNYDEKGKRLELWKGLSEIVPVSEKQPSIEEVQERLVAIQTLEAVKAIEEKVITDVREADVGAVFGWGYMPYTGGPISYIDTISAKTFWQTCEKLYRTHGERFKPCKLLREMGKMDDRFYSRFDPEPVF